MTTEFPQLPDDDAEILTLDVTDYPLPNKLNPATRYGYFKTIAKGGKSLIQTCRDMHLQRVVCYKSLLPEFRDDPVEQNRLLREARVSAMLQHPNTVPTYEIGRNRSGHIYFTMKLIHGYTLREVLNFRQRYDLGQLIDVLVQVLYALEYAHSHRVIHRDLKPENILVGRFGEVLLLDWGMAKVWRPQKTADSASAQPSESGLDVDVGSASAGMSSGITGQGKLQGTVAYMSPEQIRRDADINFRSDIFGIGVMLYEVLAGSTPGASETVRATLDAILNDTPPLPSSLAHPSTGLVPPRLEELAMACLAKSPRQRPDSCGEILRWLRQGW